MEELGLILMEGVRVAGVTVFWAVMLPLAAVFLPMAVLWKKTAALFGKGITVRMNFRTSLIGV